MVSTGDVGGEYFILQKNFDGAEGELTEPDCKQFGLLFYVNETDRDALICEALSETAKLVSREDA